MLGREYSRGDEPVILQAAHPNRFRHGAFMATGSSATKKGNKWVSLAIETAILVVALVISLAIRFGVYESAIVISRSMEPTLLVNDRLIVDHRLSLAGTWRRGDIILFDAPPWWGEDANDGGTPMQLVKRIVGMPGETVDVTADGNVYINVAAKPLHEPYVEKIAPTHPAHVQLGEAQYFVMGDNRPNSDDSRRNGPINDENIHGRIVRIFWPLARSGAVSPPNYD
jgi:signal peptidase I